MSLYIPNVLNDYNPTEVNDKIKLHLENFTVPKGISFSFTGEQEKQAQEMAFLSKALLIAVLLIFLIMVAQFNSATTPVIISISVLLSLIGVLFGLLIFRMGICNLNDYDWYYFFSRNCCKQRNCIDRLYQSNHEKKIKEKLIMKVENLILDEILESVIEGGKNKTKTCIINSHNHHFRVIAFIIRN